MEYVEKSKHLQEQLKELRSEIEVLKVEEKHSHLDEIHDQNILQGNSKYTTIGRVRDFYLFISISLFIFGLTRTLKIIGKEFQKICYKTIFRKINTEEFFSNLQSLQIRFGWYEIEEAVEDRKSYWNHVALCIFDAEWSRNQDIWIVIDVKFVIS